MKKTERLNGIVYALKEKGRMNAQALAVYFEVDVRTIYRDIDALSQLKVPIITYEGRGGGYEIEGSFFMPSIRFDEREIVLLLMLLKLGETVRIPNFTSNYHLLSGKLTNTLNENEKKKVDAFINQTAFYLAKILPGAYQEDLLSTLIDGMTQKRRFEIDYYAPKEDHVICREISPTQFFFSDGAWYLKAYCHLRNEERTFRFDRIRRMICIEKPSDLYESKRGHENQGSGGNNGTAEQFANDAPAYVLEMSASLYRIIKENDYMMDHTVLGDSQLDWVSVCIRTLYKGDLKILLLTHPDETKLIEPLSFVNELSEITAELTKKY